MLCELYLNLRKTLTKKKTLDHDFLLVKLFSDFLWHSDKIEPPYLVLQGPIRCDPYLPSLSHPPSLPSSPILHLHYSPGSLASHFQLRSLHLIFLLHREATSPLSWRSQINVTSSASLPPTITVYHIILYYFLHSTYHYLKLFIYKFSESRDLPA